MKKAKKIDSKTKNKAIAEYQSSGNASAVARKYGIARSTLLTWLSLLNDIPTDTPEATQAVVKAIETTSAAAVRSIEQAAATRQEFFAQHYAGLSDAFSHTLKAITDRVKDKPDTIPTRDLAAIFTALTNFAKEFTPVEEQGTTTINLLQQTVNN